MPFVDKIIVSLPGDCHASLAMTIYFAVYAVDFNRLSGEIQMKF